MNKQNVRRIQIPMQKMRSMQEICCKRSVNNKCCNKNCKKLHIKAGIIKKTTFWNNKLDKQVIIQTGSRHVDKKHGIKQAESSQAGGQKTDKTDRQIPSKHIVKFA